MEMIEFENEVKKEIEFGTDTIYLKVMLLIILPISM